MRSFLVKDKRPILKWKHIPENTYFEGKVPKGYALAISPSYNYVVVDVDNHGINGFENIPKDIKKELDRTLNYPTKNEGRHYWLHYTGDVNLANKTSGLGIDLRTSKGYVVWYPKTDIRNQLTCILNTSEKLNKWLEELFYYKKN